MCTLCSWDVSWYILEDTQRMLVEFKPGQVTVVALPRKALFTKVWPPSTPARARRPRRAAHAATEPNVSPEDQALTVAEEEEPVSDVEENEEEAVEGGIDDAAFSQNGDLLLRAEAMGAIPSAPGLLEQELEDHGSAPAASSNQPYGAVSDDTAFAIAVPAAEAAADGLASPPPMEPPDRVAEAKAASSRGPTQVAAASVSSLEGGRLAYHLSKQSFEAVCAVHPRCVLTRTSRGRHVKQSANLLGGRPCGFLACWLKSGSRFQTKEQHWDKSNWTFSQAERQAARDALNATAPGRNLLLHERERQPEEPEEPESLTGLA